MDFFFPENGVYKIFKHNLWSSTTYHEKGHLKQVAEQCSGSVPTLHDPVHQWNIQSAPGDPFWQQVTYHMASHWLSQSHPAVWSDHPETCCRLEHPWQHQLLRTECIQYVTKLIWSQWMWHKSYPNHLCLVIYIRLLAQNETRRFTGFLLDRYLFGFPRLASGCSQIQIL